MQLSCPRCQTTNEPDAHYCKVCGTSFNVKPIRQNSITAPILIIVAIVVVCGFCGILSLLTGNKNEVAVNTNSSAAKSFTGTATPTAASPESTPSKTPATTEPGDSSAKGAVVIVENANLRQTADANGEVVEMLPENTETEVTRQKGAWFYVRAGGKSGWLHGNTIRLAGSRPLEPAKAAPSKSRSNRPSESEDSEDTETDSAASDDTADSSRYVTGPRGGCYYISRNGNKTYVDRSLCGGISTGSKISPLSSSSGSYTRGPRGGCYYINRNGNKTYVDRGLCN